MILLQTRMIWGAATLASGAASLAGRPRVPAPGATPFSCNAFSAGGRVYSLRLSDATGGWPVKVSHALSTPPTTTEFRLAMDLCSPLAYDDRQPAADQCEDGTLACLNIVSLRDGDEDRLLQVIPLATIEGEGSETSVPLHWTATPLDRPEEGNVPSSDTGHSLRLAIRGAEYASVHHKLVIDLECDHQASMHAAPRWTAYDPLHAEVRLHWRTPRACPLPHGGEGGVENPTPGNDEDEGEDEHEEKPHKPVPSPSRRWGVLSTFFLLIGLSLALYFAAGMWYNLRTYGSAEIPHRDFWRESPYLLRDLLKQAAGAVGAGAGALGQNVGVDARFWGPKRWSSATARPRGAQDGYEPV